MGPLTQCLKGKTITNFARHFQKCSKCDWFLWRNTPTPLDRIPFDIQTRYALVGGCPAHRLNHRDLPSTQRMLSSEFAATSQTLSSPPGPAPLSSSQTVGGVSYARPLSEAYARGFVPRNQQLAVANSQLEASQRLTELRDSSTHAIVWSVESQPPKSFTFVNKVAGQFVVSDHLILTSTIVNGFISYLESPLSKTWTLRDARVPIPSRRDVRVLLRMIDVSDEGCVGLEDEVSRLLIEQPGESALTKTRALLALSGSGSEQSKERATDHSAYSRSVTPVERPNERPIAPLRFPVTWAYDMVQRMSKAFPGCVFTSATVYKHLKIHDDAVKFNLLDQFSSRGQNIGGKWADLVKAVEEHRKMPMPEPPSAPSLDVSDNEPDLEYNVMRAKKEVYSYKSGQMECGSVDEHTPCEEMDVLICDASVRGHGMKIQQGTYSLDNILVPIALKTLHIPDLWAIFRSNAELVGLDLAGLEILPTFYSRRRTPWESGVKFSVHSLGRDGVQGIVHGILTAFSHFTYQYSNHRSVYTDFQGNRTIGGWKVFDSRTHMRTLKDSPSGYPAFEDQGREGIDLFVHNHICGSVCGDLGLNSIPLVFPPA
ncbi:hypothetical protein C8F04DRAFT_1399096 [Mycena alexandri]|uniref:Alpha-type protein kinase domain-containing protein n=1 Tax=Mycena alexandri TaxID=1745969 RepID=A0AAD6SJ55_9AGAR|nr:hypothetical protein C8F04DRAFT_1399096 [Mycena alexandri]